MRTPPPLVKKYYALTGDVIMPIICEAGDKWGVSIWVKTKKKNEELKYFGASAYPTEEQAKRAAKKHAAGNPEHMCAVVRLTKKVPTLVGKKWVFEATQKHRAAPSKRAK